MSYSKKTTKKSTQSNKDKDVKIQGDHKLHPIGKDKKGNNIYADPTTFDFDE